jgi:hypothetical protein
MNAGHPFDEPHARDAERLATSLQAGAEQELRRAFTVAADAERAYRKALAEAITRLHADGTAWTACGDLARGDSTVADLRYARDVAEGVKEAAVQASWRHAADRRALGRLVEWSARRDLAATGETDAPGDPVVFGARRAAA